MVKNKIDRDKIVEILRERYKSFTSQKGNWNFFSGLADYVKTIEEISETKLVISEVTKEETKLWEAYHKLQLFYNTIFYNEKRLDDLIKYEIDNKDPYELNSYKLTPYKLKQELEIIKNKGDEKINSSALLGYTKGRYTLVRGIFEVGKDPFVHEFIRDNYELYITRIHFHLTKKISLKPNHKTNSESLTLFLDQNGNLYKKLKPTCCYPMEEKSTRYKIIHFLAINEGYQLTKDIFEELDAKSEQTIRTEIGKIRKNIWKYLKINGADFLQGKKGSGYKINPKYKIIPKKNE